MKQEIKQRLELIQKGKVPEGYKKNKEIIFPIDWEVTSLNLVKDKSDRYAITGGPFGSDLKSEHYTSSGVQVIQLQNIGDGSFINESKIYTSVEKANQLKSCNIYPDEIIISKMGDPVARACIMPSDDDRYVMSSDGIRLKVDTSKNNNYFIFNVINSFYFRKKASRKSIGTTRLRISLPDIKSIEFPKPKNKQEQDKLSLIIKLWDDAIKSKKQFIGEQKELKKGLMQRLLKGEVRFPEFNDEWNEKKIIDVLDYEQPTPYIVDEVLDYSENKTPVLTANKSFILGSTKDTHNIYSDLPVIIFDDFTIDNKYVDFPFKVKSSAMKILKAKEEVDTKFIYELMQFVKFPLGEHKRYYISEYQYLKIKIPSYPEQQKISEVSKLMDKKIKLLQEELQQLKEQKKGLMQLLLTGIVRVKVDD